MKKFILSLMIVLLTSTIGYAQTYLWIYRSSADCDGLTDGKARHLCFDTALETLWKCVPSAGDCDTAGEWVEIEADLKVDPTACSAGEFVTDFDEAGTLTCSADPIIATEIDTAAELDTIVADENLLVETEIDASSELAAIMDDETGSGLLVFGTSPTLITPALGTPSSGNASNLTALNATQLTSGSVPAARVSADHIDAITEIAAALKTGSDTKVVTGTAGGSGNCAEWNADGDLVEAASAAACGSGGSGDNVSVNSSGADTTANFLDGDIVWTLTDGGAGGPDDITGSISFINSSTATAGRILIADNAGFNSNAMSGDVTIDYLGVTTIGADTVALTTDTTGNYTASIADAGNSTITVVNGSTEGGAVTLDAVDLNCTDCINATEIEDIYLLDGTSDTMTGTLTADGLTLGQDENITLGAQTLDHDGTDFVFNDTVSATNIANNSATATAGNIYVGDGVGFYELPVGTTNQVLTADTTLGTRVKWADSTGGASQLTGLADVNSATATRGHLMVFDGATLNSFPIGSNDELLTADNTQPFGVKWAGGGAGATQLTGLADVSSATATAGRLLIADGANFISSTKFVGTYTADSGLAFDLGAATSFQLPNGATPTVPNLAGDIVIDTNHLTNQGVIRFKDDTQVLDVVATTDSPADNEIPKYDSGTGTITWEADAGGSGGLGDLSDVNSATATLGHILISTGPNGWISDDTPNFAGRIVAGGTDQSSFTEGLVVNEGGGADNDDDFRVETDTDPNAFVIDASAETADFGVDVTGVRMLIDGCEPSSIASDTYFPPPGGGEFSTTETLADYYQVGSNVTVSNLWFSVDTQPTPGGDQWAITIRDDGVNTAVTCTIDSTTTTCADNTNTASIAANSKITILMAETGAENSGGQCWSFMMELD